MRRALKQRETVGPKGRSPRTEPEVSSPRNSTRVPLGGPQAPFAAATLAGCPPSSGARGAFPKMLGKGEAG